MAKAPKLCPKWRANQAWCAAPHGAGCWLNAPMAAVPAGPVRATLKLKPLTKPRDASVSANSLLMIAPELPMCESIG